MKRIIFDEDGNAFEVEDGKPNDGSDKTIKSGNRTIHLNGGNYTQEIKGNYIQGNVISFGKAPTPTPTRKDLSKDGELIDVKSEEV